MAEAFFAISSSRVKRPIRRSSSAILACSWLFCSPVWNSWGASSRNSLFQRVTIWELSWYWRQTSARLLAPLINSSTTRALNSGVNLRRVAMLIPSSWTIILHLAMCPRFGVHYTKTRKAFLHHPSWQPHIKTYHYLVESYRENGQVRQRTLAYLGEYSSVEEALAGLPVDIE